VDSDRTSKNMLGGAAGEGGGMTSNVAVKELDPRMTFETFVVGPANRLAAAAAKRVSDSPGTSYNPLFLYAPSGLGKSHILMAIAHHAARVRPDDRILFQTMEGYLDELTESLEGGERDELRERYARLDLLLLDDVQFLSGQPEAQELLLRTLDALSVAGSQIALASDRPPSEIDGLDERLLSRFSGGLIVDMGPPEYETRVAIVRRRVEERGATLESGVAEALARPSYRNVRELGGALNRILAVQDLEGRRVGPEEARALVGGNEKKGEGDEFGSFLSEVATRVEETVATREEAWRVLLRKTAEKAEEEGFSAGRLRRMLGAEEEPEGVEETVEKYREAVARLKEVEAELVRLGNPWPEAATALLRDPERLDEAEGLLASARERSRPFPEIPGGPTLDELSGPFPPLAVKAAARLVETGRPDYNPLFLWDPEEGRARRLLEAAGRSFGERRPGGTVALTSAGEFAEEFIEALSSGVAGAWRERWWHVDLLLVHGTEELAGTERAQDEFFHLFEALKRREARIVLAADRAPGAIEGIDERLRTRFEGGLVIELREAREGGALGERGARGDRGAGASVGEPGEGLRGWRPSPEKVVWEWPDLGDRIVDRSDS